jgi:hypothetical protein
MLKKYGAAYLLTSISLALVSFYICYFLVKNGVDVKSLFARIGLEVRTSGQSNAGTAAIAYVFHKAASPIRFPPTVALTPIVANWLSSRRGAKSEKQYMTDKERKKYEKKILGN